MNPIVAITCSITCRCGATWKNVTDSEEVRLRRVDALQIDSLMLRATDAGWAWSWRWWLCPVCAKDQHARTHPPKHVCANARCAADHP